MKKIFILFLCALLAATPAASLLSSSTACFAENHPLQEHANIEKPVINARHAIVIERQTGRVLFEKNAYQKTAMASTTKLMTALIVAENTDISSITTVSSHAAATGGSTMGLRRGEQISIRDLLYGLMLKSGNDAAIALAETVAGSVEAFCDLMNQKALVLGAVNTHFTSPHGLDDSEHYTTAYDLALICRAASENIIVKELIGTKHYSTETHFLINTNPFLGTFPEITGGKTGFTNNAGRCIALTASKNGMETILILIGCTDSDTRLSDGKKLLSYTYENFSMKKLVTGNAKLASLRNTKSRFGDADIIIENDIMLPISITESNMLTISLHINGKEYNITGGNLPVIITEGEISAGAMAGTLSVTLGSEKALLCERKCYVTSDITEKDFWYYLKKVIVCWFGAMV